MAADTSDSLNAPRRFSFSKTSAKRPDNDSNMRASNYKANTTTQNAPVRETRGLAEPLGTGNSRFPNETGLLRPVAA